MAKKKNEPSDDDVQRIHRDAEGQFAPKQTGGDNDGVASARPKVVTGSDDATMNKWPPGKKNPPRDWSVDYDVKKARTGDE